MDHRCKDQIKSYTKLQCLQGVSERNTFHITSVFKIDVALSDFTLSKPLSLIIFPSSYCEFNSKQHIKYPITTARSVVNVDLFSLALTPLCVSYCSSSLTCTCVQTWVIIQCDYSSILSGILLHD